METEINEGEIVEILEKHGYIKEELIGSGGFSRCYKILSKKYNTYFVCKVILINEEGSDTKKSTYVKEVNALMHLSHPNIIEFYDYFAEKRYVFIIIEYCPGGDLFQYVKNNGPLPEATLLIFARMVISALYFIHQNHFVHLDIKPSNMFIDKNGRIKLADFGLAQEVEDNQLIAYFLGSPAFLSPEIIKRRPYNPYCSDMWALGVTFFYLATGEFPFPKEDREILKQTILCCTYQVPFWVNNKIRTIIHGTLVDNPDKRLTAQDVFQILNKQQEGPATCEALPISTTLMAHPRRKLMATKSVVGRAINCRASVGKPICATTHPLFVRPKSLPANKFIEYTKMAGL